MNPSLDRRFPSVADIERKALRRMPRFMGQYLEYGMGDGGSVRRNRRDVESIELLPRYALEVAGISIESTLCGRTYSAPFGVAPVGLGGLSWPRAPQALASAAREHRVPFTTATFSFASMEELKACGGDYGWFQLYRPNQADIEADMVARAERCGYRTLVVTVDVPAATRRNHDIRNGFSLPPRFDFSTAVDLICHPAWSIAVGLETLRNGFPRFENFEPYVPANLNSVQAMSFKSMLTRGNITPSVFTGLRGRWPHQLFVKGVLDPGDAERYRELGADAIVISNHGGRQLEAAPSAVRMLPLIRRAVGEDYPLIVDGGVRSGLDICRMLALGANFVLLGRAFYYAIAAMGPAGADHVMQLLKSELECTMGQLGCVSLSELPDRLLCPG